ncbi:MAG: DUF2865 domain-containing protein [Pseudolabrys sp.]
MNASFVRLALAGPALALSCAVALAQSQNPVCQRLEAQLASLDRGNADPARAEQIRRAEEAVNRLQFEVDRQVAQSRRIGCQSSGFFSIFSSPPAQCGNLEAQIRQARSTLERAQNQLEQLHGGTTERAGQRQSLLIALADNGCGPQYRNAAVQQGGFLDRLFGNNNGFFGPGAGRSGTFRTICVRTCDGYYFPISFATDSGRFADDEQTCRRMCPAAHVELYSYQNPGEDVSQAVSIHGQPYTALPTAFRYRQEYNAACSCRHPGQSWAEAMKASGPDQTLAVGDVVVTEERSKKMSQPRNDAIGKLLKDGAPPTQPTSGSGQTPATNDAAEPPKSKVRTVGPTFYPVR